MNNGMNVAFCNPYDPFLAMSCRDLTQEARRLRRANRKLRRAIRQRAKDEGDNAAFTLENPPPKHKPWRGAEPENTRQSLLLAGMDCQQGQLDLFQTDGSSVASAFTESHAGALSVHQSSAEYSSPTITARD
jgi:hypothetical protein